MAERCPHYDVRVPWVCQDCGRTFKADPWDRYYTRPATAQAMIRLARLGKGTTVLEPSAGNGAIVRELPTGLDLKVTAVELIGQNLAQLHTLKLDRPGLEVVGEDFLRWKPGRTWDVAIMNPPYSSQDGADGLHVARALQCCRRVVALVRTNFLHGIQRYHQVFRWAELRSVTVLVRRPKFVGPANKGDSARHDYQILELVWRQTERHAWENEAVEMSFLLERSAAEG